ncbi:TadE/TadG family type IV pilus assembly protein [Massilia sp. ST3]|uniref:TadE/TadG family type IV pilus assembly protein n=1 Tax=Massilia sp. ST3 TaxID=2824903 RepID=UPI001B81C3FD|nr:TadE family protein [Massilia sp. ST3]MBQ5947022.1 pilus assembly protein [Massilia sp. ST3]
MKIFHSKPSRQRGAAAVELALILPILFIMLMMPLFISRFLWHYTVAQKAAQDAARYLSTISEQEMREATLASWATGVATQIARAELEEIVSDQSTPTIIVTCGDEPCSGYRNLALPETVSVTVRMGFFDILGFADTGRYGIPINVTYEMNYVGG